MRFRAMPIFLAFSLMGLADAMGPMSDGEKKYYEISDLTATLLPFFVFISFAIFSIPGGLLAARIGKKRLYLRMNSAVSCAWPFPAARSFRCSWVG